MWATRGFDDRSQERTPETLYRVFVVVDVIRLRVSVGCRLSWAPRATHDVAGTGGRQPLHAKRRSDGSSENSNARC